jgi:hypothetical protein
LRTILLSVRRELIVACRDPPVTRSSGESGAAANYAHAVSSPLLRQFSAAPRDAWMAVHELDFRIRHRTLRSHDPSDSISQADCVPS